MDKNNQEIEIKIKLDDAKALMKKIESLGAKKILEGLESDTLFNNASNDFSAGNDGGKHLRLRKSSSGNYLTYKENISGKKTSEFLQERVEVETPVEDYEQTKTILEKLGFNPCNTKEKKYEKYKYKNVILEFHTLPFLGNYLEIEASKELLETILPELGLKLENGINKGYFPLFQDYLKDRSLDPNTPFTFEEEKKHDLQNK